MAEKRSNSIGKAMAILAAVAVIATLFVLRHFDWKVSKIPGQLRNPVPVGEYDHVRGDSGAGVTIVVYTDFGCAQCLRLHANLKAVQQRIPFRWVHRQYPLEVGSVAENLAVASECAAQQGRFWEFVDTWYVLPTPKGQERQSLGPLFRRAGVDPVQAESCLGDGRALARVRESRWEGERLGLFGTPTFFINGKRYSGAKTEEQLVALLMPEIP